MVTAIQLSWFPLKFSAMSIPADSRRTHSPLYRLIWRLNPLFRRQVTSRLITWTISKGRTSIRQISRATLLNLTRSTLPCDPTLNKLFPVTFPSLTNLQVRAIIWIHPKMRLFDPHSHWFSVVNWTLIPPNGKHKHAEGLVTQFVRLRVCTLELVHSCTTAFSFRAPYPSHQTSKIS